MDQDYALPQFKNNKARWKTHIPTIALTSTLGLRTDRYVSAEARWLTDKKFVLQTDTGLNEQNTRYTDLLGSLLMENQLADHLAAGKYRIKMETPSMCVQKGSQEVHEAILAATISTAAGLADEHIIEILETLPNAQPWIMQTRNALVGTGEATARPLPRLRMLICEQTNVNAEFNKVDSLEKKMPQTEKEFSSWLVKQSNSTSELHRLLKEISEKETFTYGTIGGLDEVSTVAIVGPYEYSLLPQWRSLALRVKMALGSDSPWNVSIASSAPNRVPAEALAAA